jgi:organic hydroperoxide reductase OsmC/OhrA
MSTHAATVAWVRPADQGTFLDGKYSRRHAWRFDGGVEVPASSAPSSVPLPMSAEDAVDPEEALVAALSSCHMLFFLAIAGKRGFVVERYDDDAAGELTKVAHGKVAITEVTLRPRVVFGAGPRPDAAQLAALHQEAHERCYIANSINATVKIDPVDVTPT